MTDPARPNAGFPHPGYGAQGQPPPQPQRSDVTAGQMSGAAHPGPMYYQPSPHQSPPFAPASNGPVGSMAKYPQQYPASSSSQTSAPMEPGKLPPGHSAPNWVRPPQGSGSQPPNFVHPQQMSGPSGIPPPAQINGSPNYGPQGSMQGVSAPMVNGPQQGSPVPHNPPQMAASSPQLQPGMPPSGQVLPGQPRPPPSVAGMRPPMTSPAFRQPGPPTAAQIRQPGPPPSSIPPAVGTQQVPTQRPFMPGGVRQPVGPPPTGGMRPPAPGPPGAGSAPPGVTQPPPPPMGGPRQPSVNNAPPTSSGERPGELPVPFHGQAQYSHQVHGQSMATLTPGSEPNSQLSSRDPSPIPANTIDALEGQFVPTPTGGTPGGTPVGMPGGAAVGTQGSATVGTQGAAPGAEGSPHHPSITGRRQYPQMPGAYSSTPPTPSQYPPAPTQYPPAPAQYPSPAQPPVSSGVAASSSTSSMPGTGPQQNADQARNKCLNASMNNLSLQNDTARPVNLLQVRHLVPPTGVEPSVSSLPDNYKKVNCSPEILRSTLNSIPNTQSLLSKCRLPLGILIHPFKDLVQLPVIQSSIIVRCRTCRTYINPFVGFVDSRRWKCNLCYRVNDLPEEFHYDPVSRTYGEPQRRPEIKSATIEFIAPSEYMLRPPQPAVYLYVLDVSYNAVETGYLQIFCQTLLDEIDHIPGDARTQIGFITFDRSLHFYNLAEGLSQPQQLVVSDVDEVFLPCPDNLLVNLQESKELVVELLNKLPDMVRGAPDTGNALGPALQAAFKLLSATGGRMSVFQTQLPSVGVGALKCREEPNERTGKSIHHLAPATDFYKKMSLDCSGQQIAVDLFMLNAQYADIATVGGIAKFSGGGLYYFPNLHTVSNPAEVERFEGTLRRYFTRKIGFEAVMRLRCTKGLSIHTFHGNFFVRSTDLLSLPNINPDAGFGMQMSLDDNLECSQVCFQAALLYTSSKGERRIRVHTLCLPVTNAINEVYANADQQAIAGLLAKMAVDKSMQSMGDARDAMLNAATDMLSAYGGTLTTSQRMGQLPAPFSLRLMPLYVQALMKSTGFRVGSSTKLDDRVHFLELCKNLPLPALMTVLYPNMFPVHALDDVSEISKGDSSVPQPGLLQLSAANIDRHGAYLMDTGPHLLLWLGAAITDRFCQEALDKSNFQAVPDVMLELPELENPTSERLRSFVSHIQEQKAYPAGLLIIREDSKARMEFITHLIEDRTESSHSYYEFLQHLQKELKT